MAVVFGFFFLFFIFILFFIFLFIFLFFFFITVSEKAGLLGVCRSCKKIGELIYICNIDVLKRADGWVE